MCLLNCLGCGQKSASISSESGHFQVRENEVLSGKSGKYKVKKLLNNGAFGQVAHCVKVGTKEQLAVKFVRNDMDWAGKREVAMMKELKRLNQDQNNLVRFVDSFRHRGHSCLVFEKLDEDLHNFLKRRCFKPLGLPVVRVITQQVLVALDALKSLSVAHTDIKADNIMIVNQELQPFKVKLIDFGLATKVSGLVQGRHVQPIGYRAPEVILGLPLSEAIDMWSLGCIVAFMCLGSHLYPRESEYEVLRLILQMQGQPDDDLLHSGVFTSKFFIKDSDQPGPSWTLKTQDQYNATARHRTPCYRGVTSKFTSLDEVVKNQPVLQDVTADEDTEAFLSLLRRMLHVDPAKRITPRRALGHRFITMKHLRSDNPYVTSAHLTVKECQMERPVVEFQDFVTSSEVVDLNEPSIADQDAAGAPNSDGDGLVEVKTHKNFLKKSRQLFTRMMCWCCGRAADAEGTQKHI